MLEVERTGQSGRMARLHRKWPKRQLLVIPCQRYKTVGFRLKGEVWVRAGPWADVRAGSIRGGAGVRGGEMFRGGWQISYML